MTATSAIPQPPYKKPPIVEAVMAIHFTDPLELKWIDTFALKRKARFPHNEDMIEVNTSFDIKSKHTTSNIKKIGSKLSSADGTRVVIMAGRQMAVGRLAPYTDWDTLRDETREQWNVLAKIAKHRTLSHVSTRYINRIDVPVGMSGQVDLHKYFSAGLSLPDYAQAMALQNFHINCSLLNNDKQYKQVLQIGSTPSPLIDHISFLIDIDTSTTGSAPMNEEKMWELLDSLREYKNDLFESCITSETRKLFQ